MLNPINYFLIMINIKMKAKNMNTHYSYYVIYRLLFSFLVSQMFVLYSIINAFRHCSSGENIRLSKKVLFQIIIKMSNH